MNFTKQLITIIVSSGGFSSLVFFVIRYWFKKQLDKDLESHKGVVYKDIETHKGNIKEELDIHLESYKGVIQKDMEYLKDFYIKENLESTRFVEVICRQRITWLDQLREDITEIVSKTNLFVEISQKHLQTFSVEAITKGIEMILDDRFSVNEASNVINTSIANAKSSLPIKTELIAAIIRLKLKLNPDQDEHIVNLLDSLIESIDKPTDNSSYIYQYLDQLQTEGQKIIKKEWERVKQEVKLGKEIKKHKLELTQ